jgi:hypothetical protein
MAIRHRRNAPLSRAEVSALKSILFSHGKRCNPGRKRVRRAKRSRSRALIVYSPRALIRARKARKVRRHVAKRARRAVRRRVARRTVRRVIRHRAVRRVRRVSRRRAGLVLRVSAKRGAYRYYAKLTPPEADGIRIARHQRISVLNAIRKAKRTPRTAFDYLPAAYQRINPAQRIGMWLNASEVAGVKAARSARMRAVAGARFRRSPNALESHDTSYGESYSMDNPRTIIRRGKRRFVRITTKRGKKVAEFRIKRTRKGRVPARLRKFLFKAGTKRTKLALRKARKGWLAWRRKQLAKKARAARAHRKVRRARRVVRRTHKRTARRTVRRSRR